jgi:hypothetical protein
MNIGRIGNHRASFSGDQGSPKHSKIVDKTKKLSSVLEIKPSIKKHKLKATLGGRPINPAPFINTNLPPTT